jgi:ubiquinone/menaquinone biosynthesis C-methylase UbiE
MTADYFNNLATSWDAKYAETDLKKLTKMAARLDIETGSNVLDIGSGTGVFVPFLLAKTGAGGRLTCLDAAYEMLAVSRSKSFKGNIEYVCADIENSGIESGKYDAAVCYSSFPHFHDKPKALKEINRLLRPGGRLFICHTSNRSHINERHGHIPMLVHDTIPDEAGMRELLTGAGFTAITIEDTPQSYLVRAQK